MADGREATGVAGALLRQGANGPGGGGGPAATPSRPGEWFLHWSVNDLDRPALSGGVSVPWCPWRRWLYLIALEGRPKAPWRQGAEEGTDPTPYPSAEAAVAASMTLGLETNARLPMGAVATPLSGEQSARLPTPAHSTAAVEELVLLYVGGAPLPPKPFDDYVSHITAALWRLALADSDDVRDAVDRLVDGGRLVRGVARIGAEGGPNGTGPRECPILRLAPPAG